MHYISYIKSIVLKQELTATIITVIIIDVFTLLIDQDIGQPSIPLIVLSQGNKRNWKIKKLESIERLNEHIEVLELILKAGLR